MSNLSVKRAATINLSVESNAEGEGSQARFNETSGEASLFAEMLGRRLITIDIAGYIKGFMSFDLGSRKPPQLLCQNRWIDVALYDGRTRKPTR
jgi:hypothetical protein